MRQPRARHKLIQDLSAQERLGQPDPEDWLKEFDPGGVEGESERGQLRQRTNLDEGDKVSVWTRTLGVTEEQLRRAVAAVGDQVDAVRGFLKKE